MPTKNQVPEEIKVDVTLRHSHSDGATIRQYAINSVQEFSKYIDGITTCHVVLDHQKHDKEGNKVAEILVHTYGKDFYSKHESTTYEKAIDACVEVLCRQLNEKKRMMKGL